MLRSRARLGILSFEQLASVPAVDGRSAPEGASRWCHLPEEVTAQPRLVRHWHDDAPRLEPAPTLRFHCRRVHACNFVLWHLEDLARDPGAPDCVVAAVKRRIDVVNQVRSDEVERLDEQVCRLLGRRSRSRARLHSETVGALVDRLSISALKTFHAEVDEQTGARGARARLLLLRAQRRDLSSCMAVLVADLRSGRVRTKVYRQVKTYNDAELNPVLRRQPRPRAVLPTEQM